VGPTEGQAGPADGRAEAPGPWTEAEVGAFLAGYGRRPRRLTVEALPCWWFNLVLRVEADGETLVLRRYGITPPEEVRWELALLRHLRAGGFPTIAPLVRPDGAPFGRFAGKPAILYPYIPGHSGCAATLDRETAMLQTATAIGRLHRLTGGLTLPYPRVRSGSDSRRLLAAFRDAVARRGVAADEPALAGLVAAVEAADREFAARLAAATAAPGGLPEGVVHHDAHCANVLFRDGRLVALIDFDDACPGPLVGDVGVLLGAWAIDPATDALDPERAGRLLRAYERERPLGGAERDLLPDVLALYLLGDAAAGLQDVLAAGGAGAAVEAAVREEPQYRRFRRCTAGPDWREGLRRAMRGPAPAPPAPGGPRR